MGVFRNKYYDIEIHRVVVCVRPALQSCGYILPCQDHGGSMFSMCSYHCALKVYFIMLEGCRVHSKTHTLAIRSCMHSCIASSPKTDSFLICGHTSVLCACPSIWHILVAHVRCFPCVILPGFIRVFLLGVL